MIEDLLGNIPLVKPEIVKQNFGVRNCPHEKFYTGLESRPNHLYQFQVTRCTGCNRVTRWIYPIKELSR